MKKEHQGCTRGACRLALALLACVAPAVAFAQTPAAPGGIAPQGRPERPYRGLFGSAGGNSSTSLTFEGKAGGGVVENPLAEQGASVRPGQAAERGRSGNGSGALSYSVIRTKWGVSSDYMTLIDYNPSIEEARLQDRHTMSGTIYFLPRPSTRISFSGTFKNFPEFSLSDLFDSAVEQGIPVAQDPTFSQVRYKRYGTTIGISHSLSTRARVTADLGYAHGKVERREWVILNGSANVNYNLSKGISLFAGYQEGGQRDITPGADEPHERQPRVTGGVDFSRPLSFSRRTTLTVSTGLAGAQNRAVGQTVYHLVGGAHLNREFGQTWNIGLSYNRSVRHLEPLKQSVLLNSLTYGIQGSFTRRLQFQARLGHSTGEVASSSSSFDTQFATVRLSYALSKQFAFGADYSQNRMSALIDAMPQDGASALDSWSVRSYVQVWVPLLTRTKRPR